MATLDTVATRPSGISHAAGKAYFETSTNKFIVWNGAAWLELHSDGEGAVPPPYFKYSITLAAAGNFTLNFDSGNDITVAWGDGNEDTTTGSETSLTHAYAAAGDYEIAVSVNSGDYGPDYIADTTSQNSITSVSVDDGFSIDTDWSSLFMRYRYLTSVSFPADFANNVTNVNSMFRDNQRFPTAGFPEADFQSVSNVENMFYGAKAFTEFPDTFQISSNNITSAKNMFFRAYDIVTAPDLNLQNCTDITSMFNTCRDLTSIPAYNLSSVTNASNFLMSCSSLTSIPTLDFSECTNLTSAFQSCALTSLNITGTGSVSNFSYAFRLMSGMTSFPSLDFSGGTNFSGAWRQCPNLSTFPANAFDTTGTLTSNAFSYTFNSCALSAQSIENILVSLDANGATGVTLHIDAGTNAGQSTWSAAANAAFNNLQTKGWTVTYNA